MPNTLSVTAPARYLGSLQRSSRPTPKPSATLPAVLLCGAQTTSLFLHYFPACVASTLTSDTNEKAQSPTRLSLTMCCGTQITSLFLHFFPACVAWTERWHTGRHTRTLGSAFSQPGPEPQGWADASFTEVVLFPMVPYLAWAVLYYAKVLPAIQGTGL